MGMFFKPSDTKLAMHPFENVEANLWAINTNLKMNCFVILVLLFHEHHGNLLSMKKIDFLKGN